MNQLPKDMVADLVAALDYADASLEDARQRNSDKRAEDLIYVVGMTAAGVQTLCYVVKRILATLEES